MKKQIIFLFLLVFTLSSLKSQSTSETRYYNDKYSSKEVPQEKAKYSKTITTNADSSVSTEIKKLKTSEIIHYDAYKGKEPVGIWKYETGEGVKEMDYGFKLIYKDPFCDDSLSEIIKDYFEDNDSIGYAAPKIASGEKSIYEVLSKFVIYPVYDKERGIMGTVYLNFRITKDGNIEDLSVTKGKDITLDKEAVRVIRFVKFSSPPYLNGKPISVCVRFPFKFTLE